jgi:hypothetical protein
VNVFVVEPDDLLLLPNDSRLSKRGHSVVDRSQIDASVKCASSERHTTLIVADQSDESSVTPKGHDVGRRICRATEDAPDTRHPKHRNGSFRGNPTAVTEQILVQNRVSKDGDPSIPKVGDARRDSVRQFIEHHRDFPSQTALRSTPLACG